MLLGDRRGDTIGFVQRLMIFLLLFGLVVELGPACGLAGAVSMDGAGCCQSKCLPHSSRQPHGCCQLNVGSDKAAAHASLPLGSTPFATSAADIASEGMVSKRPVPIIYRSPAPPPASRLAFLCSRQI